MTLLSGVSLLLLGTLLPVGCASSSNSSGKEPSKFANRLVKKGRLNSPLVEVTPFVFKGRLYRLENWQKQWEFPGSPEGSRFQEDQVRIRDVEKDQIVSTPLTGHGLGMAFVWQNRVYVFAGNWGNVKKWNITEIEVVSSQDLCLHDQASPANRIKGSGGRIAAGRPHEHCFRRFELNCHAL